MNKRQASSLTLIEGQQVNVALRDGTRIDDCQLVSGGRKQVASLWLFSNGEDVFVPRRDVVDVWETRPEPRAA